MVLEGQWIGTYWGTVDRNVLGRGGVLPEDSYSVKTVYLTVCCKDQFPDVIVKHWTFKATCMALFDHIIFFFSFLIVENDWLYLLEDRAMHMVVPYDDGEWVFTLSDGALIISSALPWPSPTVLITGCQC